MLYGLRGCPRCPVVLRQIRPNFIFARWETVESFCLCFLHSSQEPGRRPPHVIGRSVNTVRQEWVGVPQELATLRFHDAVVDFVEPGHEIVVFNPRLLDNFSSKCCRRLTFFFPLKNWKAPTTVMGPLGILPYGSNLAGIFEN